MPWAGHTSRYAIPEIYEAIRRHRTTLLFVNTRSQAEMLFQELWRVNEDNLPIALHHGSLDVGQRRRVEKAMESNSLRAIVATSTLDLGIDWGDVDLVIHVGAPKGASRLAQRIGRSNHRMDEPSRAILVPANRFEVLECRAALEANYSARRTRRRCSTGALDVLSQQCSASPAARRSLPTSSTRRCAAPRPMPTLDRQTFDRVVDFVATGGYALRTYERYARIRLDQGRQMAHRQSACRPAIPAECRHHRREPDAQRPLCRGSGKGTVARGGPVLGKIEEYFARDARRRRHLPVRRQGAALRGHPRERMLRLQRRRRPTPRFRSMPAASSRSRPTSPSGARHAGRSRALERAARAGRRLAAAAEGEVGAAAAGKTFWSKRFRAATATTWSAYPFEGRLAHQTLGMLLTRRLERAGARPLGFVATDYSLAVWALGDIGGMFRTRRAEARRSCSTRTCWATISRPGWTRATCSSACSAIAR